MTQTGIVVNGAIVPDGSTPLREGARCLFKLVDEFPPNHPMAPYDRDNEVAIIRASIADPEPGIPLRQAFEELSRKHGLEPLPPE
jgi:hypothetical protein